MIWLFRVPYSFFFSSVIFIIFFYYDSSIIRLCEWTIIPDLPYGALQTQLTTVEPETFGRIRLPPTPVVAKQSYVLNVVYFRRRSVRVSVNLNHIKTEIAVPMPPHQPACACAEQVSFLPSVDRPKSAGPPGTFAVRLHLDEHNAASIWRKRNNVKFASPVLSARMQVSSDNAPSKFGQIARRDILPPTSTRHTAVDIHGQRALRFNLTPGNKPF